MKDRQRPVMYLKKYLGIKEGSKEHVEIIKTFNDSKLCKRYTMTTKDHWCATAVSAAFIATGLTDIFPCVECSCGEMINKAKKAGIWVEKDNYVPKIGDVILYDWDDTGAGDNTGYPEHVGIVAFVDSNSIKVIEGNKEDSVDYRTIKVDGKFIRGYIVPKYSKQETVKSEPVEKVEKPEKTEKKKDDVDKNVKWTGIVSASLLNVRTWAGKEHDKCSFGPLKKGTAVQVCDTKKASDGSDWYYIKYNGRYGFVSAAYINKA